MTRRPNRRAAAGVAAAGALLAATAGCSGKSEAAPATSPAANTPSATTTTSTPTPTVSTSLSREDQAIEQAEQAVREYYRVGDRLGTDPNAASNPLPLLKTVAIGTGLNDARNEVVDDRKNKLRQIGNTGIASMTVRDVDLTYKPKQQPPVIPTVQIDVCYDVSKVNVVDESGKSVVAPDREEKALERLWLANYSWPDPTGWKVAATEAQGEPCSDSS